MATLEVLPETEALHWRPRVDAAQLRRQGRLWTLTTVAHIVPFVGAATMLMVLQPLALPVALACLAHAWIIPELYAQRGANVLRPRARAARAAAQARQRRRRRAALGRPARRPRRRRRARAARAHGARARAGRARPLDPRRGRRGAAARPTSRARLLLLRQGRPAPARGQASCPAATASPTCCSRCAATSRASRRSPTSPSPARAGGCGGACARRCGRRSTPRS